MLAPTSCCQTNQKHVTHHVKNDKQISKSLSPEDLQCTRRGSFQRPQSSSTVLWQSRCEIKNTRTWPCKNKVFNERTCTAGLCPCIHVAPWFWNPWQRRLSHCWKDGTKKSRFVHKLTETEKWITCQNLKYKIKTHSAVRASILTSADCSSARLRDVAVLDWVL